MKTCSDPTTEHSHVNGECVYPIPGFSNYAVTKDGKIWSFISDRWLKRNESGRSTAGLINDQGETVGFLVSRVMGLAFLGVKPGQDVDHINRDKSDDRLSNLRVCSRAQNLHNASMRKANKSGYIGVCWHKTQKKWVAFIKKDYRQRNLGCFATAKDAALARDAAAKKLHGEFANLNFPR